MGGGVLVSYIDAALRPLTLAYLECQDGARRVFADQAGRHRVHQAREGGRWSTIFGGEGGGEGDVSTLGRSCAATLEGGGDKRFIIVDQSELPEFDGKYRHKVKGLPNLFQRSSDSIDVRIFYSRIHGLG